MEGTPGFYQTTIQQLPLLFCLTVNRLTLWIKVSKVDNQLAKLMLSTINRIEPFFTRAFFNFFNDHFMRFLLSFVFFSSLWVTTHGQRASVSRPNIIVFLVEDMGWQDTSVPFHTETTPLNKKYHTPNMVRLAGKGMKFTNAYSTPVCTPTRASFLTGMNAAHHRVTNWTNPARDQNTDAKDDIFLPVDWNINGVSPVKDTPKTLFATPMPKLLKDAGYFTIHSGKGHWGSMGTPGSNPTNMGFIVNIGGHATGSPQSYKGTENYGNLLDKTGLQAVPGLEEYYGSETFLSEALTIEALKALSTPVKTKQPFYLHMAHYAVHTPIQEDARFYQKYLTAGLDSVEAKYASLIEGMDKSLGDILDFLEVNDLEKNTIIIFMSDNGGLAQSPARGGPAHSQNLPLRSGKGSVYEGGIREPMLVKWPGVVKPNSICSQSVIIEDFFPTILEMASVPKTGIIQETDGFSFIPYLKNPAKKDMERSFVWHYPNKWGRPGPGISFASAIRKGDWKLVYLMKDQKIELYNLADDIGEMKDLSKSNPAKARELAGELTQKLKKWDAQMPTFKQDNSVVKWPDEL
jgi:arylsulfatase A-like enzyme